MTQRVFDIENEKDMQDLWNILPDWAQKIKKNKSEHQYSGIFAQNEAMAIDSCIFKINWHDKTEITRPIQEATEQDIGKLCAFYDEPDKIDDKPYIYYAVLRKIENQNRNTWFYTDRCDYFTHCRRLTKQEIEELC